MRIPRQGKARRAEEESRIDVARLMGAESLKCLSLFLFDVLLFKVVVENVV